MDFHALFCKRVGVGQSHCAQAQRQVALNFPIKFVADNRQTGFGQMHANLMRATGDRFCFNQSKFSARLQHFEMRFGILCQNVNPPSSF